MYQSLSKIVIITTCAYLFVVISMYMSSCTAVRVITAKDRKHQIESPESVQRFVKKKRMAGYPILQYGNFDLNLPGSFYSVYNAHGQYLSTDQDAQSCRDRASDYRFLRYLLEYGDTDYMTDSVTRTSYSIKASAVVPGFKMKWTDIREASQDTTIWGVRTYTFETHLDNYLPYIRSLEGSLVQIDVACGEFVILRELYMHGKASLDAVLIRELIEDVEKLNKEFDNRIHLYLVYLNTLDWMEE